MKTRFLAILVLLLGTFNLYAQYEEPRYVGKKYELVVYVIDQTAGLTGDRYEFDEDELFYYILASKDNFKKFALFDKKSNICIEEHHYEFFDQNKFDNYFKSYERFEVEKSNLVNEVGAKVYKSTIPSALYKYFSLSILKDDDGSNHTIVISYFLDDSRLYSK